MRNGEKKAFVEYVFSPSLISAVTTHSAAAEFTAISLPAAAPCSSITSAISSRESLTCCSTMAISPVIPAVEASASIVAQNSLPLLSGAACRILRLLTP